MKTTSAAITSGASAIASGPVSPADDLAAKPNASSIMSAPRDQRKNISLIIILALSGLLIISLVLNFVVFSLAASRRTEIERLERDINDNQAVIIDLKERLHEL